MRMKNIALATLAAGFLAAAPFALAQHMEGGHHHEGMELLHGLNLSDAQQTQLHQIMTSGWAEMKTTRDSAHALHEQLVQGLLAGATHDQLAPLVRQEEALRDKMDSQHLTLMLQARQVLTPDQLAQAATKHTQLEALHAQEHQVMGGEPAPE